MERWKEYFQELLSDAENQEQQESIKQNTEEYITTVKDTTK